jgi:hypothetical protein
MNVGIMQGFEDDDEEDEDENEGPDEEMSSAELTRRTPQSPEILMNNLRGDMRSVDARYEELAQMVGEEAAMGTPPEVLALLQGQMAQQQQAGIGALPQAPEMPSQPPVGIEQMMAQAPMPMDQGAGMMPQGPLPTDQGMPPVQMARGGYVQHFADGSDEEGVTPVSDTSSFPFMPGMFDRDTVSNARTQLLNLASQRPIDVPTLEERVKTRLPEYQRLLGTDRSRTEAAILLDLAQASLAFAANVDPVTGQPMRGSFASRLAGAARTIPATINERVADISKADRAIKLASIEASEKDIDAIRNMNLKLEERKRQALKDIVSTGANPFKALSGMKDIDVLTFIAPMYKDGTAPEEMRRVFEARATNYTQPKVIQVTDPVTGNITQQQIRNELPSFVAEALRSGQGRIPGVSTRAPTETKPAEDTKSQEQQTKGQVPTKMTIWDRAEDMTGPLPALGTSTIIRPFVASTETGRRQQEARSFVEGSIRDLIKNLQNNPRYPEGERKAIESELDISTRFWDSPTALRNRLQGINDFLAIRLEVANEGAYNETLPKETRQAYRTAANDLTKFRALLMPPRVTTRDEVEQLEPGTRFIWTDGQVRVRK